MLDALRFVGNAVARKDYVPELSHFKIKDGRITGFNGTMALSTDIDIDLDVHPNATKFQAAVKACAGTITLHMTAAGKLAVKAGKFRSYVDCLEDVGATFVEPEGETIDLGPDFMRGLRAVSPAMGFDASRPWAMGIKLQSQSMFATNNVMLVQYWHGSTVPVDVVIPDVAVRELLRIGDDPLRAQVNENSISFWFSDQRWLRTSVIPGNQWPIDRMEELLSRDAGEQCPFPTEFFEHVDTLKPFLGEAGTVYVTPQGLTTSLSDGEGTAIEVPLDAVTEPQAYHHKQLVLLGALAQTIDWTNYPRPCMFRGERLRGALVGQRI